MPDIIIQIFHTDKVHFIKFYYTNVQYIAISLMTHLTFGRTLQFYLTHFLNLYINVSRMCIMLHVNTFYFLL